MDQVLRTNPKHKSDKLIQTITGISSHKLQKSNSNINSRSKPTSNSQKTICVLSETIKWNQLCIANLQIVRDNLLSAYMVMAESIEKSKSSKDEIIQELATTVGDLVSLVGEASSLAQKLDANATGLHVVVDFFRNSKNVDLLDFSKNGRISISHFSCNEATSMCLTWLQKSAEKLLQNVASSGDKEPQGLIRSNVLKIYSSFELAISQLRNSSQLGCQVFRVLLYCSSQGKLALRDYLAHLHPTEINDMITEVQILRRQYDQINILIERLGWSLADIFTMCTGNKVTFGAIRKEGCIKPSNLEEPKTKPKNAINKLASSKTRLSQSKAKSVKKLGEVSAKVSKLETKKSMKARNREAKFISKLEKLFLGKPLKQQPQPSLSSFESNSVKNLKKKSSLKGKNDATKISTIKKLNPKPNATLTSTTESCKDQFKKIGTKSSFSKPT